MARHHAGVALPAEQEEVSEEELKALAAATRESEAAASRGRGSGGRASAAVVVDLTDMDVEGHWGVKSEDRGCDEGRTAHAGGEAGWRVQCPTASDRHSEPTTENQQPLHQQQQERLKQESQQRPQPPPLPSPVSPSAASLPAVPLGFT